MPTKTEGRIHFDFPSGWSAVNYDAEGGFYRTTVTRHVRYVRGMDLVTAPPGSPRVIFIEVKDFRSAAATDPAALNATLLDTVLRKTLYTMAGLLVAERTRDAALSSFAVLSRQPLLHVVLFLAEAPPASLLRRQTQRAGRNDLEQTLTAQLAAWNITFALRGAPLPLVPASPSTDGWTARVT